MPESWKRALQEYSYPFDLRKFKDAASYPGWFEDNADKGDRQKTMAFEARFREQAPSNLEAWYEVVYWKSPRRVDEVIGNIRSSQVTADELWKLAMKYMENPTRDTLRPFKDRIVKSPMIATVTTFPAFICPTRFPMVDRYVVRWAKDHASRHSYAHCDGPDISIAGKWKGEDVRDYMWPFVDSWTHWCRFTARRLSQLTKCEWRARDVEMAVFAAQHKCLELNPING